MPITFSEQFNISKEVLEITGVFDVILDIDTRVFIDPALLELCTEPEFLDARKKVEKYFSDIITLLRHSKSQTDMYRKRAERMLTFTELSGTCFGYSQNGTGGNAIGSVLRKTILNTIQDLMTEGDTDPVLFELLGVFQEGIGCDRVSDLITFILREDMTYVAAYNSLGFSTAVLGEDRANSAGKRAMQLGREGRLFTADPSSYDGSVPREAMGAMSPLEELAYLKARNAYLEELVAAQKKLRSALEDTTISLNPKV